MVLTNSILDLDVFEAALSIHMEGPVNFIHFKKENGSFLYEVMQEKPAEIVDLKPVTEVTHVKADGNMIIEPLEGVFMDIGEFAYW